MILFRIKLTNFMHFEHKSHQITKLVSHIHG